MRKNRRAAIRIAMAYPMADIIARYRKDSGVSAQGAREHERELKRYLVLNATSRNGQAYPMAGPVDELWHTFLLFTMEYADFCQKVAGRFLHHVPVRKGDAAEAGPDHASYLSLFKDYEDTFGEPPPDHIWPRPKAAFTVVGWE